jgi:hypothetical protein
VGKKDRVLGKEEPEQTPEQKKTWGERGESRNYSPFNRSGTPGSSSTEVENRKAEKSGRI